MILPIDTAAPWETFYYAIKWRLDNYKNYEYLKEKLLHHIGDRKWILGKEIAKDGVHEDTDGEHVHVLCQMTKREYESLNKNIKDKYKLRGVPRDGKAKQYGKVKQIRSIDRMAAYVIKDGNYETNLEPEIIEKLKELLLQIEEEKANMPKEEEKKNAKNYNWKQKVVDELNEIYPGKSWTLNTQDYLIIESKMFDMLGRHSKDLDSFIFKRLFYGIYNKLAKTIPETTQLRKGLTAGLRDELGLDISDKEQHAFLRIER